MSYYRGILRERRKQMNSYQTIAEAETAAAQQDRPVAIIEIEAGQKGVGRYILTTASEHTLRTMLATTPMPEIKSIIGEVKDALVTDAAEESYNALCRRRDVAESYRESNPAKCISLNAKIDAEMTEWEAQHPKTATQKTEEYNAVRSSYNTNKWI